MQGRKLTVDTKTESNHLKAQLEKYRKAQKTTGCTTSLHDFSRAVGLKRIDVRRFAERYFPDLTFTLNVTTYDLKEIVPINELSGQTNVVKKQEKPSVKRNRTKRNVGTSKKTASDNKPAVVSAGVNVTQEVSETVSSTKNIGTQEEKEKGVVFPEILFVDRPYFPVSKKELDMVRRREFLKGMPAEKIVSLEESCGLRWSFIAKREKVSLFIVSSFFKRRGIAKQADGILPDHLDEKIKDFMLNNKVTVLYAIKHLSIVPQLVEKSAYAHLERKKEGIAEKVARGRKKKQQTVTTVKSVTETKTHAFVSPDVSADATELVEKETPKSELTPSLSDKLSTVNAETLKYVTTSLEHDLDYKLRNLLALSDSEIVELKLYLGFGLFNSALVSLCENR